MTTVIKGGPVAQRTAARPTIWGTASCARSEQSSLCITTNDNLTTGVRAIRWQLWSIRYRQLSS